MKQIFLIHIMKTAGTTFRRMLDQSIKNELYPTQEELNKTEKGWYLLCNQILDAINSNQLDLSKKKVICGHYQFVLGQEICKNPFMATFLRDPVKRTISMIGHRINHSPRFKNYSISDMLNQEVFVKGQLENYQTKIFAMNSISADVNEKHDIDEQGLKTALTRLKSLDFIGITEIFDESIKLFNKKTGIHVQKQKPSNVGKSLTVTQDDMNKIKEVVKFDIILYEEAKKLFYQELKKYKLLES